MLCLQGIHNTYFMFGNGRHSVSSGVVIPSNYIPVLCFFFVSLRPYTAYTKTPDVIQWSIPIHLKIHNAKVKKAKVKNLYQYQVLLVSFLQNNQGSKKSHNSASKASTPFWYLSHLVNFSGLVISVRQFHLLQGFPKYSNLGHKCL